MIDLRVGDDLAETPTILSKKQAAARRSLKLTRGVSVDSHMKKQGGSPKSQVKKKITVAQKLIILAHDPDREYVESGKKAKVPIFRKPKDYQPETKTKLSQQIQPPVTSFLD